MKRKIFPVVFVFLVIAFVISGCAPQGVESAALEAAGEAISEVPASVSGKAEEAAADIYFENGVIYTVDENDSVAEALAIKGGEIIFVGSATDGQMYKDSATEVMDLDGQMMLPGFIDGHIHPVSPGFFDFSLVGITDVDGIMDTLEQHVRENPDKESYIGFGYMTSIFLGDELQKGPKKERLDEIVPDKPIFVISFDGHAVWLNSKAFEAAGITKETESTPGGEIVKDDATGELWGTVKDTAMSLLPISSVKEEKVVPALREFNAGLNSLGYTSIMAIPGDGTMSVPWEGYAYLEENDELTLRMHGLGSVTGWKTEENLLALEELKETYSSDLVKLVGAKIFADGVLDSESAYLIDPYSDDPESRGASGWEPDALNEATAAVNEIGVLSHFHAIGDQAVRMALDAVEYAQENIPDSNQRNAITHMQLIADEDLPRFGEMDVVAVANPYWHLKEPGYFEPIEHTALGERAEYEYPLRSLKDNGAAMAFASDFPVTSVPNPFLAIETGVTRNLADGAEYGVEDITDMDDAIYLLNPEERLTVEDMIRGFTAGGAYAMMAEDITGTLETGKSADLIIIDQNLLTVDPLKISDTKVLKTYFQGELVYSAQD